MKTFNTVETRTVRPLFFAAQSVGSVVLTVKGEVVNLTGRTVKIVSLAKGGYSVRVQGHTVRYVNGSDVLLFIANGEVPVGGTVSGLFIQNLGN